MRVKLDISDSIRRGAEDMLDASGAPVEDLHGVVLTSGEN